MKQKHLNYFLRPRVLLLLCTDFFVLLFSFFLSIVFAYAIQLTATSHKLQVATIIDLSPVWPLLVSALAFAVLCILGMAVFGVYKRIVTFSVEGVILRCLIGLVCGSFISALLLRYAVNINTYNKFVAIISTAIGIIAISFSRTLYSYVNNRITAHESRVKSNGKRCVIIGAGFTGQMILKEIYHNPIKNYYPVCFLDDDLSKSNRNLSGVPIYAPTLLLPEICKKHEIEAIIFAIPSCMGSRRTELLKLCSDTGCEVIEIPSLLELSTKGKFLTQSKSIDVNELLNREVVKVENSNCNALLMDKTVMVTGVGSIGSELCRQIVTFGPKKLIMVDIYENNVYDIQQELINSGYGDIINVEIASVRDCDKMEKIFELYRPDIVFHAAAHKHVPLMEHNPEEAVKNNILGTYNVAQLCFKFECEKMLLISTDKAVNPTNVMGATKRCCEMIMQYMSQKHSKTDYFAVRFGNVLGSNGSVIPLFCRQIEAGGPVTVTHPDIIRYFMTIPEAVNLVLQAGAMAKNGQIFVLNMGDPVKITTLAENLIRMYGYEPYTQMPIEFTGLRPGEKLFEELLMNEENLQKTAHEKIFIGNQIDVDPTVLEKNILEIKNISCSNDSESVIEYLHKMVPTFKCPCPAASKQ